MTKRFSYIRFIKSTLTAAALVVAVLTLTGCFKDFKEEFLFKDFMVEFDDASWQSPAPGKDYPILGPYEKGSGVYTFKVNLLGMQKNTPTTINYRVVSDETTAEQGKHFALADNGSFTIDANSSTGEISVEILDFPSESGTNTVVLELVETDGVKVSQNYKRIGISISLVGPPSSGYPLYTQLGPESYYNSMYFDMMNPDLPADIRSRMEQSAANLAAYADGTRRLQSLYLYFDNNDTVHVVAQYYGGGGAGLANGAIATWTYKLALGTDGKGRFEFVQGNSNGNAQKNNFAPILNDYLEQYEFKVDWVDAAIANPPRPGVQLGGLFRTDNPASYIIGSLENLSATGSVRPYPLSPKLHEILADGQGGYYSTLLINPEDPGQSEGFRNKWNDGKAYIAGLAGRQLHNLMLYFNPDFNLQDIQLVTYYYSSTGGKFIGQMRFAFHVDFEGVTNPLQFFFQNGNGGATRPPQIVDDFLMKERFKITRTGNTVRFTEMSDPSVYFEGQLGNHPLNVNQFWPE